MTIKQRAGRGVGALVAWCRRVFAAFDLADLHVYGGLALVWWGVASVSPWVARLVVGSALVALGMAGVRPTPPPNRGR